MDTVQARPTLTGHDDAPVVSYVQQLLEQAVALKASDLHF
jgi:type IV pilus assembly protein PilB